MKPTAKSPSCIVRWLTMAASLCATSNLLAAASQITFTDTWEDAGATSDGSSYLTDTGTFSVDLSLPLGGVDLSRADAGSSFALFIGPAGNPTTIVSDTLGDALSFSAANKSATFPIVAYNDVDFNAYTNGSLTVTWTATNITVTGSASGNSATQASGDILQEHQTFVLSSTGTASTTTINSAKTGLYYEVSVMLDTSDNKGGTFTYDNPTIPVTGSNSETEWNAPDSTPAYPDIISLESGSVAATATPVTAPTQVTFTDTWHDTGADSDGTYYPEKTGSFMVNVSLPLGGIDLSHADSGSSFSLSIGPAGSTINIASGSLGGNQPYAPGQKYASFPIVASDSQGDQDTLGGVTVSWSATNITVIGSASGGDLYALSGDVLGEEALYTSNANLNTSATGVYYEVNVVLDTSDNGGETFKYDNLYVPINGNNSQSTWKAPDGSGTYALESGSITGSADSTPPKVSITAPVVGFEVYSASPVVSLKGQASDNDSVADIEYYVNGDASNMNEVDASVLDKLPTNSIAWTASVDLSKVGGIFGTNVITVVAWDNSGNQASVSRAFAWVQTSSAVLTINPANAGTVKGIKSGQTLQAGQGYPVTATPASKSWIFSGWTDGSGKVLSLNPTFTYMDTDGKLTANFLPNPFNNTPLGGTYTGLFYDTNNGVSPSDAGYIKITVTSSAGFSGSLSIPSSSSPLSFSGQLLMAPDGSIATVDLPITVSKSQYLDVSLRIATIGNLSQTGAGMLGGSVKVYSDPTETNLLGSTTILGELALNNTNVPAGLYNVVISPVSGNPSKGPGGYSYGSATVKSGAVSLGLHLADGVSPAITFPSYLAQDGTCPFYASLYSGKGVILGWMHFATNRSGVIAQQPVSWVKLPVADKYYTNGFTSSPILSGALYVPPGKGTNILGWTSGNFTVDYDYANNLSLPGEVDDFVKFSPANNTFTDTNKVTISFTPSSGAVTGTFFSPAGGKTSFSFNGVLAGPAGYGFYAGTNYETGPIWIH